jgi:outer membrane protein OmpA-like peptidoglycan-associated protein
MRLVIVIVCLMLVPAFSLVLEWRYDSVQRPRLEEQCRALMDQADLPSVAVAMDHFHVRLSGLARQPDDRDKAANLIRSVKGVILNDDDNRILVPAHLAADFEGGTLRLKGWVDAESSRQVAMLMTARFRPEMPVLADGVRVNPHVVMGQAVAIDGMKVPTKMADFLNSIRPPSSLTVTNEGGILRLTGYVPSETLRGQVIAAIQTKPWEWPVEASKLYANAHVAPAPFTKGEALVSFLKRFADSPTPGNFSIDLRNGPRFTALATPAMEAEWRRLLLPLSGASKVQAEVTQMPSLMHFPGFIPQSPIPRETLAQVRAILRAQMIHFDKGSPRLVPSEQAKLGPLVFAVQMAGPEARFVVAGYDEPGGEPNGVGGRLRVARAEAVRAALAQMGVPKAMLEVQGFDGIRSPGVITEETRRQSRRVELLVK